jgi:hypothetical protein
MSLLKKMRFMQAKMARETNTTMAPLAQATRITGEPEENTASKHTTHESGRSLFSPTPRRASHLYGAIDQEEFLAADDTYEEEKTPARRGDEEVAKTHSVSFNEERESLQISVDDQDHPTSDEGLIMNTCMLDSGGSSSPMSRSDKKRAEEVLLTPAPTTELILLYIAWIVAFVVFVVVIGRVAYIVSERERNDVHNGQEGSHPHERDGTGETEHQTFLLSVALRRLRGRC